MVAFFVVKILPNLSNLPGLAEFYWLYWGVLYLTIQKKSHMMIFNKIDIISLHNLSYSFNLIKKLQNHHGAKNRLSNAIFLIPNTKPRDVKGYFILPFSWDILQSVPMKMKKSGV